MAFRRKIGLNLDLALICTLTISIEVEAGSPLRIEERVY